MLIILSAVDTAIVVRDHIIVDQKKSRSGISDGVADSASIGVADGVAVGGEAPETLAIINIDIGDLACMGRVVNGAKGVSAGLALLEIGGEQRRREARLDVIKEGQLLLWLDCVDRRKCQAQETVVARVLGELGADLFSELNSLIGERGLANGDGVSVYIAAGATSVAVGYIPGIALKRFRRIGLGWVISVMAINLIGRCLRRENPAVPLSAYHFESDCLATTHRSEDPVSKSRVSC